MNANIGWPYIQQPNISLGFPMVYALSDAVLEQIRDIVQEEVHNALHPEEERPSATVEYEHDGKRWKGTVYLVEDEDEDE